MDDSDSDLSSLSSVLSDVEADAVMDAKIEADIAAANKPKGIAKFFKPTPKNSKPVREVTPEPPKRAPSPPHEFVLADNDAIAFIVMFRSRFSDCFFSSLPHYGPQDIERGVVGEQPDENIERLLCALLNLVLNRTKPVERLHYGRALEEAISEHKNEWPIEWNGENPLRGSRTFQTMTAEERLVLLKALILWSLHHSELVKTAIKDAYKQTRREDDKNQPKSVQPWFTDSWRKKYYLIEGREDSEFRIYRENDSKSKKTNVWFSVAGSVDEAKGLADKLESDMSNNAGKLIADKIRMAVPRWEAGEEKRRKRDYRLARKAAFTRPEPGVSWYEGRTRGKRIRYDYEGPGDDYNGDSSRAASSRSTPFDEGRPVVTASGRQVKSRLGGVYGESMLTDQRKEAEREPDHDSINVDEIRTRNGRPVRSSIPSHGAASSRGRYADGLESGSETGDEPEQEGDEWSGNEDEPDDEDELEAEDSQQSEDELMDDADGEDPEPSSLVVKLTYKKHSQQNGDATMTNGISGTFPVRSPVKQQIVLAQPQPQPQSQSMSTENNYGKDTIEPRRPDSASHSQTNGVVQPTAFNGSGFSSTQTPVVPIGQSQ